jgi:3-oxoacyl-[acyl-carrier protein] reductase
MQAKRPVTHAQIGATACDVTGESDMMSGMELGLSERVCVVTGASSGIGLAVAGMLCKEGASVMMLARDPERLERAATRAREQGSGRVVALALDVVASEAAERVQTECDHALGPVDVLVNNAGTSFSRPHLQLSDTDWQSQWELHVMAPMRFMRALAPGMAERGWGRIVNVSSASGKRPSLTNIAYSVTKAALLSLSRAFAETYASTGVLINAVAPGMVDTELWSKDGGLGDQRAAAEGLTREQVFSAQVSRIPLGRFATPDEVANVIVFLCSRRASDVAGAAWSVDGGAVPVII